MRVRTFTPQDAPKWDAYVLSSETATFFHLTGWRNVVEKTFGHRPCYLLAEEAGEIKGILPLFLVKNLLFGRSLVSVPLAVYGGICTDSTEAEALLLEEAQRLAREFRAEYLELRNIYKTHPGLPIKDLYVTFRREIYEDPEKNLSLIPRKQRRMIRQGQKNSLRSEISRGDRLREFYAVYAHSLRNLGTPVFPFKWFEALLQEFQDCCQILVVTYQEKIVAGVLTFFFKEQVMPFYSGAYEDYFRYAVNDFMYWELMCYGSERGYKVFDFGRSKKGTGSYDFKRHWGMEPLDLHYQYDLVRAKELPNLSPTNPRYANLINLWKRLPLPATKILGPKIAKYIP